MKALGFEHRYLVTAVVAQSLLLMALALPLGALLAWLLKEQIESMAPVYLISIYEPLVFTRTLVAGLVLAVVGALVPLRSVRRADPMLAFQGA